jgi:hypothetical protein
MGSLILVFMACIFIPNCIISISIENERNVKFKKNCSEYLKEKERYLKNLQKSF